VQFGIKKLSTLVGAFFLAWLAVKLLLPIFSPFLFGAVLAMMAEPIVSALTGRLHLPRSVGSGIGVTAAFIFLCALLLTLCAFALRELKRLYAFVPDITLTAQNALSILRGWLLTLSQKTPESIQPLLHSRIETLFSDGTTLVDQSVRSLLGIAGNLVTRLPDNALTIGTAILSAFMISAKLPDLRQLIKSRIPGQRLQKLSALGRRMKGALSGWLLAQLKLTGITFLLLTLGFRLLRISNPLITALLISAVDAFPILGTGAILLPWSLIRLLQGDAAHAVGLLGVYVTVSLLRSTLEPRLVGRQLGLDPLVTLITLYAGFQLWGIGGMLLAPVLAVTAMQILPENRT
jgi:sporulation integral membrane protein YtvI